MGEYGKERKYEKEIYYMNFSSSSFVSWHRSVENVRVDSFAGGWGLGEDGSEGGFLSETFFKYIFI